MSVAAFFRWWTAELAGLLPAALRGASGRAANALLLSIDKDRIAVQRVRRGASKPLGTVTRRGGAEASGGDSDAETRLRARLSVLDPRTTRIAIEPGPGMALFKTLRLPLAAAEELRQVVGFQLHRETPFTAEHAYYDYRVLRRDRRAGQIEIDLWVMPRRIADWALSFLEDWDLRQIPADDRDPQARGRFHFLPAAYRGARRGRLNAVLLFANALLIAAVVAVPLHRQQTRIESLRPKLEQMRRVASEAAAVRDRADATARELARLAAHKTGRPATITVIEELARVLPDSTWLSRLDLRDGKLTIYGSSQSASALVALIEGSKMFKAVSSVAPVTRDAATGRELFRLSAQVDAAPKGN